MVFRENYKRMNKQIFPDRELLNSVIHLIDKTQNSKKKTRLIYLRPIKIFTMILVCTFILMPVVAASVPSIYELMYSVSPNIAQFFTPIQKSCEDNGIKMEVVSSYIHDDCAEVYISMQDLKSNRIDDSTDLNDSYSIHRPFDSSATCQRFGYDDATKTVTFLISITEWGENKITDDKITFTVSEFISNKHEYKDIPINIDLLDIQGAPLTRQTWTVGGSGRSFDPASKVEVLEPSTTNDCIVDNIDFTGIGYINGMLHIQTATTNNLSKDNHGYLFLKDKSGKEVQCDYYVAFTEGFDSPNRIDYSEYVFAISPEELDQYNLFGTFITSGLFTEGNWKVTFPLEEIESD